MNILGYVIRKLKGSLRCAKEEGMVVGKNVSVMGGVDFGSEPYLITLHMTIAEFRVMSRL